MVRWSLIRVLIRDRGYVSRGGYWWFTGGPIVRPSGKRGPMGEEPFRTKAESSLWQPGIWVRMGEIGAVEFVAHHTNSCKCYFFSFFTVKKKSPDGKPHTHFAPSAHLK